MRFGNVLGSSGSVIPIFRKQIARGGPVTVTHAEMTRFFMTIPEAVQLIIQAGAIGGRGQVYVLDMGEPVKITDLADTMIRLSGKEPGGTSRSSSSARGRARSCTRSSGRRRRPSRPSTHEAIMLVTRPPIDRSWLEDELDELAQLVDAGETLELIGRLNTIVRRAAAERRPRRRRRGRRRGDARIRDRLAHLRAGERRAAGAARLRACT